MASLKVAIVVAFLAFSCCAERGEKEVIDTKARAHAAHNEGWADNNQTRIQNLEARLEELEAQVEFNHVMCMGMMR